MGLLGIRNWWDKFYVIRWIIIWMSSILTWCSFLKVLTGFGCIGFETDPGVFFFSRLYFCSQCRSLHLTTFLIAIDHWAFLKRIVVGSPVVFNMPNPSSALLTFLLFVVVSVFLDNLSQSFYKIERSARFDRSCHIVIPPILACLQRLYSLISTIAPYQCSTSMAPNDPPITQSWGN